LKSAGVFHCGGDLMNDRKQTCMPKAREAQWSLSPRLDFGSIQANGLQAAAFARAWQAEIKSRSPSTNSEPQ
jgi:hypothetical protein